MRVVVTGHCGFVGHHVVRKLAEAGHEPVGLDRADPKELVELADYIPSVLMREAEAVIHCAAHADVRGNWEKGAVDRIIEDNINATYSVLDAASRVGVKSFVFVSSGAVYADQMSPYAASKLAGEAWCKAYADKFGWRLSIVRPAACYGEGYHHGHIADFVRMARETGRVKAITRGAPRDACHVEGLAGWLVAQATMAQHYKPLTYMRNTNGWGCRGTVEVMGVDADWADTESGWLGDCGKRFAGDAHAVTEGFDIEQGVRDSLRSLGWECP